jgi:hypothetical protein
LGAKLLRPLLPMHTTGNVHGLNASGQRFGPDGSTIALTVGAPTR